MRKHGIPITLSGYMGKTPWAAKSRARRRAKNKVAKQARKVNR